MFKSPHENIQMCRVFSRRRLLSTIIWSTRIFIISKFGILCEQLDDMTWGCKRYNDEKRSWSHETISVSKADQVVTLYTHIQWGIVSPSQMCGRKEVNSAHECSENVDEKRVLCGTLKHINATCCALQVAGSSFCVPLPRNNSCYCSRRPGQLHDATVSI